MYILYMFIELGKVSIHQKTIQYMLLTPQTLKSSDYDSDSFVTHYQLMRLLERASLYKNDLLDVFKIKENEEEEDEKLIIKIGNARQLIDAITSLDDQCEKIDIKTKVKDVYLDKMLEEEKAIFEVFHIENESIIKRIKSDKLVAETAYSAKSDILDYYNLSKFANYCRDLKYEDLLVNIKDYLNEKNLNNRDVRKLRIVYKKDTNKFHIRAFTSSEDYKDYGINFSVFVALVSLGRYANKNQREIYINSYSVDDSTIYVSFTLDGKIKINENLSLSTSIILENDEIKRSSVSFNGLIKLNYVEGDKESSIYLRPTGVKKENSQTPVDLLTYPHRGSVKTVFDKIEKLPELIDFFADQVKNDTKRISSIEDPNLVKEFIADKIKHSQKEEFKVFKVPIYKKLMKVNVDSTFTLFSLLREVEELFGSDDIISLNFWRNKLYQALVDRK